MQLGAVFQCGFLEAVRHYW